MSSIEAKPVAVFRGLAAPTSAPPTPKSAVLAFTFGWFLSVFAWIANQAWTILSLALFGPFSFEAHNAWKHIIFCVIGAFGTSIAWCTVFKFAFPDEDEEEDEEVINVNSYARDISDSLQDLLQDLGELGFVVGYIISQFVGIKILNGSGYVEVETEGASSMMVVLLLGWVILAKVKDFRKATKRAKAFQNTSILASENYYVQMA